MTIPQPSEPARAAKAQNTAENIRAARGATINHGKIIDYIANYMPTQSYFVSN